MRSSNRAHGLMALVVFPEALILSFVKVLGFVAFSSAAVAQQSGQPGQVAIKPSKPQAERAEPVVFPMAGAKWIVRGRVRAATRLRAAPEGKTLHAHIGGKSVRLTRHNLACNTRDLTLPEVFVYVRPLAARGWRSPPPEGSVALSLSPEGYTPRVLGIVNGGLVKLGNRRTTPGHFYVPRKPNATHSIRIMNTPASSIYLRPGLEVTFDISSKRKSRDPDLVQIDDGADDEPKLGSAQLFVMPHHVFATTNASGRFSLPKLPDGEYELVAVHELLGTVTQKIKVEGKPKKPVTLVFDVPGWLQDKPAKGGEAARKRE